MPNQPHVCYIRHQRVLLPIHRMMMAQNMYSKTLQWHSLYCFYYWCFWVQNSDRKLIAKYIFPCIPSSINDNQQLIQTNTIITRVRCWFLIYLCISTHSKVMWKLNCLIQLNIKTCLNIWPPQVMNEPIILSFLGRYSTSHFDRGAL